MTTLYWILIIVGALGILWGLGQLNSKPAAAALNASGYTYPSSPGA